MAGITFTAGESKTRPGVYNRYVQVTSPLYEGASDGVVACVFTSQWGPLGEVKEITTPKQGRSIYGGDGAVFSQIFTGGASVIYAVRAGSGGGRACADIADAAGSAAVTVKAKYPGARALTYSLSGDTDGARKFILSEGGAALETLSFSAGGDEAAALISAGASSEYLEFGAKGGYAGNGTLAETAEIAFTAGTEVQTDSEDYADALEKLMAYTWNCICVDSEDVDVHAEVQSFMNSAARDGRLGLAIVGEPVSVALDTRLAHARAFNDYRMVYVGGGWYGSDGALVDGWKAAARVAGIVACVPGSQSVTHRTLSGAISSGEALTNAQYVNCTRAGMLTFSASPAGGVWIENGITTLNTPSGEDDRGWMKIKRARIRFELMDRANATVAPMIGNVSNDDNGRAAVIQAIQGLLRAMVSEGKLLEDATVYVDPDNAPQGDSASFIIEANDIDALEKVYFTYQFSFANE